MWQEPKRVAQIFGVLVAAQHLRNSEKKDGSQGRDNQSAQYRMQTEDTLLTLLPEKTREGVHALSERLGIAATEVVARAVANLVNGLNYLDTWSSPKHKPENPRLVQLVPDPEHRRIYRSALRAMAKDSARSETREHIHTRGRAGGLARTRNLDANQLSEFGRKGGTQRWQNESERDQIFDN